MLERGVYSLNETQISEFLKEYFAFFGAEILNINILGAEVRGFLLWDDEEDDDCQEFVWYIDFNHLEINLTKVSEFCSELKKRRFIDGDKIIKNEETIFASLTANGWNKCEIESSLDFLYSFEIKMIDNGVETDSFFIHN